MICTKDAGAQPIRWVGTRTISLCELLAEPKLYPIEISIKGGEALRVSRQHRLLVSGDIAQRMFGQDEVLVSAKDLEGHSAVEVCKNLTEITYFHLLLDEHHIINANGLAAESLYLGTEGVKAMTPDARKELMTIFPQLADDISCAPVDLCRTTCTGKRAQNLVRRTEKNSRQLVALF